MQKKYINITFCYLLCLSLSSSFISTSKAMTPSELTVNSNSKVMLFLDEKSLEQITMINTNLQQFNDNFAIGAFAVLNIAGATATTCLALHKTMDNHSKQKDQTAAFSVLFVSAVWQGFGWGILYRKEIANLLFGK